MEADSETRLEVRDLGRVPYGEAHINAHTDMLKTISLVERMTHEAFEPVRSLFREFRSRLDAIPTSRQRELIER